MTEPRLMLLSLDGGGVRGLSSLAILKQLMLKVNPEKPPLPCDYFDMIGGTSTGGLIAIMLGRLHMSVDACMDAYVELSDRIFSKKRHRLKLNGQVQGRFDSEELEKCVKEMLVSLGMEADALLMDEPGAKCKVFVCATSEQTGDTVHFTSYRSPRGAREHLYRSTRIWEACRATSAASSFFDPITIGDFGESFVDGATGANNPVAEVWNQAKDVWSLDRVENHVQCLVSIGTGVPSLKPFGNSLSEISTALLAISTGTERTAEHFVRDKSELEEDGRYYRFNVIRGLEGIGLEKSSERHAIVAATGRYLESHAVYKMLQACSATLRSRRPELDYQQVQAQSTVDVHKAVQDGDLKQLSQMLQEARLVEAEDSEGLTPLHLACKTANVAALRLILKSSEVNIEKEDHKGLRPLHYAAAAGSVPVCMALLERNAMEAPQDHQGWTPAHYAADAGHTNVLQVLHDKGVRLQNPNYNGDTSLHIASQSGQLETVYFLIESATDIQTRNFAGKTALQVAEMSGHNTVVELIRFKMNSRPSDKKTILHWAAENGYDSLMNLIIDRVDDINRKGPNYNTALELAAKNGHDKVCETLLDRGAKIDDKEASHLHLASLYGHVEVVRLFLDRKANIEAKSGRNDRTPLHFAAQGGQTEVIKILLERNCNTKAKDRDGNSALFHACISKKIPCVALVLEQELMTDRQLAATRGACVTAIKGDFPLFKYLIEAAGDIPEARQRYAGMLGAAANRGDQEMVQLMIQKGVDINMKNAQGMTFLDYAIKEKSLERIKILLRNGAILPDSRATRGLLQLANDYGDPELIQLILDSGDVDVDLLDESGRTPLLSAANCAGNGKEKEIILLLLKYSANVNYGEGHETALHRVAENQQDDIVSILLDHGANVNCQDKTGDTPLSLAIGSRGKTTVKLLLDRGADPNAGNGNQKPLHKAVALADEEMVIWLLDAGANVHEKDYRGHTALDIAIKHVRLDLIPLLETHKSDFNTVPAGRLIDIISKWNLGGKYHQLFDLMIKNGVNVNGKENGTTPLIRASGSAYNDVVERLLNAGADVNLQDSSGNPPLRHAMIHGGAAETVKILLKAGASITIENQNGENAIDWAVRLTESKANEIILDSILEEKPDINRKVRGQPLLYFAITNGTNAYTVRRLLECGLEPPRNALNWVETLSSYSSKQIIRNILIQHGLEPIPST